MELKLTEDKIFLYMSRLTPINSEWEKKANLRLSLGESGFAKSEMTWGNLSCFKI